jgi:hypothetical protein
LTQQHSFCEQVLPAVEEACVVRCDENRSCENAAKRDDSRRSTFPKTKPPVNRPEVQTRGSLRRSGALIIFVASRRGTAEQKIFV